MQGRLLELPDELLAHIISLLPIRALLKFSEVTKYARSIAVSNLHTLSLGIQPIRAHRSIKSSDCEFRVRIPDAQTYDYTTLLTFHNALFKSILMRHAATLRTVNLSIWTLTRSIAETIANLGALRHLSIKVEDDRYARAVPRSQIAAERLEQSKAWDLLGQTALWQERLQSLKITTADLTISQFAGLLSNSRRCREVSLSGCRFIGRELWQFLGQDWDGRGALQTLHVAECSGCLDEKALSAISGISGLQVCLSCQSLI